jgi:hypothetical protein
MAVFFNIFFCFIQISSLLLKYFSRCLSYISVLNSFSGSLSPWPALTQPFKGTQGYIFPNFNQPKVVLLEYENQHISVVLSFSLTISAYQCSIKPPQFQLKETYYLMVFQKHLFIENFQANKQLIEQENDDSSRKRTKFPQRGID